MPYFVGKAFSHVRRSPFVAGITVATVAVIFVLLGVFALLGYNLALFLDRLGSGLQMSLFLKEDVTEAQREAVRASLSSSPQIESVQFVDAKEALSRFKARLGAQATVLEGMEENLLPASFEITLSAPARNEESIRALSSELINLPGVEELQYGQAWLENFFGFVGLARLVVGIVAALIVCATLVVVSNTIRLSLFSRRDEILILKLVGATDGFVKAPFFVEGLLLGTLGSALGTAGVWLLFLVLKPGVLVPSGFEGIGMTIQFLPPFGVALMVAGGTVLGLIGTLMSLWRHLKI